MRKLLKSWAHGLGLFLGLGILLNSIPQIARAQSDLPPVYQVQPGDSLTALAAAWGTDVPTLMRLNDLQTPHQIYPGQRLRFPARELPGARAWPQYRVALGDDWELLSRRTALSWEALAQANGILNPGALFVGQQLHLPPMLPAQEIPFETFAPSRLLAAARYNVPYWPVVRLNPNSRYTGPALWVPGLPESTALPFPLATLRLTPQPVDRGAAAVLSLTTEVPASCEIFYLDYHESCYVQPDGQRLFAFMPLSPLLSPGHYDAQLHLWTADGVDVTLSLPLWVTSGRYDYERLDLPSDRQALLDPQLSQVERNKIASLRTLRTPERLWEFPFHFPLEAASTSYYGSRRSYGYGFTSYHAGTDFDAEIGAAVHAPASGKVVLAETLVVRGNAILIDHGWGVVTGYWHLSRIEVTPGQQVTQGQRIGAVGNTGLSTGPHLHWEMWINGVDTSPLRWVQAFDPALQR
ncbi:MAG: peptidoglycan DD-metalloendopeptidase family protein [Anaerolineae bacterium]|nr:peptidoglycan DD-metalloendopeptidase family protein [Anaerolineae bacterium]